MTNEDPSAGMALAMLTAAVSATYGALRDLGLTVEAAKDAITVHASDTAMACQYERDGVPTPVDEDGDGDGGVRTR